MELGISDRSVQRIMKSDLELHPYKIMIESLISDDQKIKRKKLANWVQRNFQKKDIMRISFSAEFFIIDDVYP